MTSELIADRYEILRLLGRGGMAEVFLARQIGEGGFQKHVVIKRILPHLADDEDFVEMLLDEARTAAELRHPNIAHVFDVGHENDRTYIAMEFVHGQDLRRVQRRAQRSGGIPLTHALQIAIDIAAGLYSAHTCRDVDGIPLEIVHRDINPQNILVSYDGHTKIVDFGIAKARSNQSNTETGVIKGKYSYMSPEQASGLEVDARSDQFAVGIVLWELIAGKRLFKRGHDLATLAAVTDERIPRPSRYAPITSALDNVVMKALSRDPADRFTSCRGLRMALEDLLAEERLVHSSARVGAWMRELFADVLVQEELARDAPKLSMAVDGEVDGDAEPKWEDGTGARRGHPITIDAHLPSLEVAALDSEIDVAQGGDVDDLPSTQIARRSARKEDAAASSVPALDNASFAVTDPNATDLLSSPPTFESMSAAPAVSSVPTPEGEGLASVIVDDSEAPSKNSASDEPLRIEDDASEISNVSLQSSDSFLPQGESTPRRAPGATAKTEVIARERFVPVVKRDGMSWRTLSIGIALTIVVLMSTIVIALLVGPETGKIVVETKPPGASVYLDGANTRRTTPTILDNVSIGVPHSIRVVKQGFPSQQFDLTLKSATDEPRVSLTLDTSLNAAPEDAAP